MPNEQLDTVVQHLKQLVAETRELGSAELLERFCQSKDEGAFAAIVERYGRLVLTVCRQVLRHEQDAEDAFQATFLVLAKKASSIRKSSSLRSWLYGVAYRVAMKSKQQANKEPKTNLASELTLEGPALETSWRELQAVLHEEVNQLPEKLRIPFVLCCLEGKSKREAAAEVGWKEGTVSGRLAEARKQMQDRLTRRGLTLSGLLGIFHLVHEQASASATVLTNTVKASAAFAAGAKTLTEVSAKSLALANGVLQAMVLTSMRTPLILFALIGLLGLGFPFLGQPLPTSPSLTAQEKENEQQPNAEKPRTQNQVRGIVVDVRGKPIPNANVVLKLADAKARTTHTDPTGAFHFDLAGTTSTSAKLIAFAKGWGMMWESLDLTQEQAKRTIRLPKDKPLQGRIVDLEGTPVAGATVRVLRVSRSDSEAGLGEWITSLLRLRARGRYPSYDSLVNLDESNIPLSTTVATDKEGHYRLVGFGKHRVFRMRFSGPNIESVRVWGTNRAVPKTSILFALYGDDGQHLASPSKPIHGVVRDRHTGKPIQGIKVKEARRGIASTTTDAEGRFQLVGAAKRWTGESLRSNYALSFGGQPGVPYFTFTKFDIKDTPSVAPVNVTVELERGVEVRGRLLDKATGKPIQGDVHAFPLPDNPHLKNYALLDGLTVGFGEWGKTAPDGTFSIVTVPGPGVLVACAEQKHKYTLLDIDKELRSRKIFRRPSAASHALIPIEPDEAKPASLQCEFRLDSGIQRSGTIVDATENPLKGVIAIGLSIQESPKKLDDSTFTVTGLRPDRTRVLLFWHPEKRIGKVQTLQGDTTESLTVQLRPLGTLAGRLVDEEGLPLPERNVGVILDLTGNDYENFPHELEPFHNFRNLDSALGHDVRCRVVKSDKRGRFRVEGLLPGQKYDLMASPEEFHRKARMTHLMRKNVVASGKVKDLGELRPRSER